VILNIDTVIAGTPTVPMFVNAGTIGTFAHNDVDTAFMLDIVRTLFAAGDFRGH
jgi:hypothetical protein